ncbi:hypothetical protein G9A89_002289 [Geosiphon pyriformis]|nr:hypothetical protein G9A89_002289 [Geosiphon pyriformis]
MVDNTMPRKTHTRTYVLGLLPKTLSFKNLSNDNTELVLPKPKLVGFNWLPSAKSRVSESCSFELVRSFALDVDLAAVSGKTNGDILISIKKIFYRIDGFGGASTLLKFSEIIRAFFTSESSMNKARELAVYENIIVNDNLKKINKCSDKEIVVKEILVNLSKSAVESSSEIADLVTAKWSVLMRKDSVYVAKAVKDKQSWISRDQYRALLYTFLVGTTAYNLSDLLESYGGRTCFIGHNPTLYVHDKCAIVCFVDETSKLAAIGLLQYLRFGHISTGCSLSENSGARVSFSKKTWAQMAGGSSSHVVSSGSLESGSSLGPKLVSMNFSFFGNSYLVDWLASLECSLELLTDQISGIMKKLSFVELVLLASKPLIPPLIVLTFVTSNLDSDMALDITTVFPFLSLSIVTDSAANLGLSSSKVLTFKMGGLEFKIVALEVSVVFVLEKLDCLCSDLGLGINNPAKQDDIVRWHKDMDNLVSIFMETKLKNKARSWLVNKFDNVHMFFSGLDSGYVGAGVAVVMNRSLAKHVYKVSEADEINSLIARAVNESSFVILGGNFNEDGSYKYTSFKKCHDLGLINSLGVSKMIDYVFVSLNLVNVIIQHDVFVVSEHFNMDHRAVFVSLGLGGLLDMRLNSLRKQANKDQWKFNFKNANEIKWNNFKSSILANTAMFLGEFTVSVRFLDLDTMWCIFKEFDKVFTKDSLKFHKLKLLVSRIVKALCGDDTGKVVYFMKCWSSVDNVKFSVVQNLVDSGAGSDRICFTLFGARKFYRASKLTEFLRTKDVNIRSAIDRRMENFEVNKDHIIRSVLEHSFCKVVLDHLVINNDLILEPGLVKSKVDVIMEEWTRKCHVVDEVLIDWHHQYQLLGYVFDGAFSKVICLIGFDKFFGMVSGLPNSKAAGLSGIPNKLWKHCNKSVLDMLLWKGVLINTHPIALIKMACKILSKILSNRIFSACSTFDVFHGDNFSVLKGTTTQSPIFTIGLVVEDGLEKDFMTDFGLMNGYCGKVFSPLLWQIFYDLLLCEVKHQKSMCRYRLNSHFISKNSHAKFCAGHSFFFAAGVFVDDTIWVGSSQSTTQHIFNVASEFFQINNILINNDKTVVISINSRVSNPSLSISGLPISITKKRKFYRYLGIFLLTEDLSKPSLDSLPGGIPAIKLRKKLTKLQFRKATDKTITIESLSIIQRTQPNSLNTILFKHQVTGLLSNPIPEVVTYNSAFRSVSDKQFLYLVLAVLYSIVSYRTQFSFVPVSVCNKWDALIHKSLKLKSGLPLDFPSDTIHHLFFYGLKSFLQCQSKSKVASLISFANSGGILGHLFTGMVQIFFDCKLFLGSSLVSSFQFYGEILMSVVLGKSLFYKVLSSFRQYGIVFHTFKKWKKLDSHGSVPKWFDISVVFLVVPHSFLSVLAGVGPLDICGSNDFVFVCDCLSQVSADSLSVYTDGSLKNLGTISCRAGAAAFFKNINLGLSVSVQDLMSSTLIELQAIALALECMPAACSVHLFSDSQVALNACKSESDLVCPDFCNRCWYKVKGHSSISGNDHANSLTNTISLSGWYLPPHVNEHFLLADGSIVSGNFRHFVHDVHWKIGSGSGFLDSDLCSDVDWLCSFRVWHSDLHMATAVRKCIYDKCYSSVLCLYCGKVKMSNHVFFCVVDDSARHQLLLTCALNLPVSSALYKGFVFNGWLRETISVFHDSKVAGVKISDFNGLIPVDGLIPILVSGLVLGFSAGVIKLLGVAEAFGVCFGFRKSCSFFSGIGDPVSVNINA